MSSHEPAHQHCRSTQICKKAYSVFPWCPAHSFPTLQKYVFDLTSIGQRSLPWPSNSVEVEMKFHIKSMHHFPSAQLMLQQMHLTNVDLKVSMLSIEFLGWVLTFNKCEDKLSKLPLNLSFCAVTANSQSRWPHGKKAYVHSVFFLCPPLKVKLTLTTLFFQLSVHAIGGRNQAIRNPTLLTSVTQRQRNDQTGMEEETPSVALCTQDDSTIKLLQGTSRLVWSTTVDESCEIFALSKLNVSGDNSNEHIVACTWDGQTYIIDHRKNVVKFASGQHVMAFLAGRYAVSPGHNSPCLVYVTFSGQVVIYWDLMHAFDAPCGNLIGVMNSSFTECREVVGSLGKLTPSGNVDLEMLRKLYGWCLYNGQR